MTQKRHFIYILVSATQGEPFKSPSDYYVNTLPASLQCVSCFVPMEQTGLDARGFI